MRVWEFEDKKDKVIPTDLVREQDFILRIRRMNRTTTPHFVINIVLSHLEALAKSHHTLELVQKNLQEFAKVTTGVYAEMSVGDVFIIWEGTDDAHLLFSRILAVLSPDAKIEGDPDQLLIGYNLPHDYQALRERANFYVEMVREIASGGITSSALDVLPDDAAQGPLTAWGVDQIGKSLKNVDMRPYTRSQAICRYDTPGKWRSIAEEFYISLEDLRRDRFPKLDVIMPDHLFLVLCETIDDCLLKMITQHEDLIDGKTLHVNMAVATTLRPEFAHFAVALHPTQRARITFELHRGDLLQNFGRTLDAIKVLKREGFKVAIDCITPDIVRYVDLAAFNTDYIKIKVPEEKGVCLLDDPGVYHAISKLPADKLIFSNCDSEKALTIGLKLGVRKFQGWLIDKALKVQH